MKLLSGFHVISLNMQGLAGGKGTSRLPFYNVIKGLRQIKHGGEDLRILYRNGLELHGYADIGVGSANLIEQVAKNKYTKYVGIPLSAVQRFTFEVVHPGIKANVGLNIFGSLVAKAEGKKNAPLTTAEKDNLGKETVHLVDRLFSGEDYKTALLQTNIWMAKNFYAPEARKAWGIALISPQWQKAHIGIIVDIAKSFATKEGRAKPTAHMYRRYLYSALSIYGIANLYNFIMTKHMDGKGKFMTGNDGHNSFSIRAPYNDPDGRKVYIRPLKSIFEIPEFLSDPIGKALGKLAPWISAAAEQKNPRDYKRYEGLEGALNRVGDASKDLFMPMAEPTIMNQSKAAMSKWLSFIGLPTSKGLSEKQIKEELKEAEKLSAEFIAKYGPKEETKGKPVEIKNE